MSSLSDEPIIDKTEQLLLDRKERIDSGIVQRIGKTVLNDGLDGVRSVVWGLYNVAEVLFPFLGACMFVSLLLNVLGYGYYFDDNGHFLFNTLDYIRQEQFYQGEFAKFTANAAAQNHPSF